MVRFYEAEGDTFLVAISGNNFNSLLAAVKSFGGEYQKSAETVDGFVITNVFEVDKIVSKSLIEALQKVEDDTEVPDFLQDYSAQDSNDFQQFNAQIDPSCIAEGCSFKGDYQRSAVLRGISQNRLGLFHEMGLGKSFEIQTIINHYMKWGLIDRYVIVSPPEGIINIMSECLRFNTFGLKREDVYIVDTEHRNPFEDLSKKLIVMTYRNVIMLHEDFYKLKYKKKAPARIMKNCIPWNLLGDKVAIILDESAAIRNNTSKTFKLLDKSKEFFPFRFILTGTPAPKYASGLWAQMRFLQEASVPRDYTSFLRSIANIGNRFSPYAVNYFYEDKVDEFLNSVSYLVDRAVQKGNIELPPIYLRPVRCELQGKQLALYKAIIDRVLYTLKKENGKMTRKALMNKFSYLSLALHDPSVIKGGNLDTTFSSSEIVKLLEVWDIEENGKFKIAKSLLEANKEDGKKTILWSGHPVIIDLLAEKLKSFKPYKLHAGVVIDKKDSVAERNHKVVEAFKSDKSSWLLIANYQCLKTSVNITEAPRQIFWDRSWDAEVFAQAYKRSHRIGQTESVVVHSLIFDGTFEEEQDAELQKRLEFNSSLWQDNPTSDYSEESETLYSDNDVKQFLLRR